MSAIFDTLRESTTSISQASLYELANQVFDVLSSTGRLPRVGRVKSIQLQDDPNTRYVDQGIIEFTEVNGTSALSERFVNRARPLDPNIRKYPVEDELVYIIGMPGQGLQTDKASITYYYISNIGIWNNPHYNGFPQDPDKLSPGQSKNLETILAGSPNKSTRRCAALIGLPL